MTFPELVSRGKRAYPVNPNASEVEGCVCYPNLSALPEKPERVLVVVAPKPVLTCRKEPGEVARVRPQVRSSSL